jgi:homoserine trans-succinylase
MPSEYEAAHMKYRELVKKAAGGDKQAFQDKAKAMGEIRQIEREAARAGTVLSAQYRGDKVSVQTKDTHSKRSLQEEYVRKFDKDVTAMLPDPTRPNEPPKEQTLQEFHRKRLFGK